jgi:hypothetical protein
LVWVNCCWPSPAKLFFSPCPLEFITHIHLYFKNWQVYPTCYIILKDVPKGIGMQNFSTSALAGGDWTNLRPGRFTPGKKAGTHYIGGLVGPRSVLDVMEKRKLSNLSGLEIRSLCRPAPSSLLCPCSSKPRPILYPVNKLVIPYDGQMKARHLCALHENNS